MLAIIIPYYKLTFFEETLKSLENQTNKRFKVYIGDDASQESPIFLLEKFQSKFEFIYHKFEKNLGSISLTKQWDRCIDLAKEEKWLMILGDDDLLAENVVEEFYLNCSEFENKANVVRVASKIVSENNQNISEKFQHPKWETASNFYYRKYKGLTRSSLSEYIFAKNTYLKYGFKDYPLAWFSDDMAWIDFAEDRSIYTINNSQVMVRISNINITGKKDNFLVKNQAEELFYTDLVHKKIHLFNSIQKNDLLITYEISIKKNRKVVFKEWKFLLKSYFRNGKIVPFLKCFRRFFRDFVLS